MRPSSPSEQDGKRRRLDLNAIAQRFDALSVDLGGRRRIEGDVERADAMERHRARTDMVAALRPQEEQQRRDEPERGRGIADIEHAVRRLGLGTDIEAAAVGAAVLHREHHHAPAFGHTVEGRLERVFVAMVEQLLDAFRHEQRRARLPGARATVVRTQRDGRIQTERQRLHEGDAVAQADIQRPLLGGKQRGERLRHTDGHAERAREIVAVAEATADGIKKIAASTQIQGGMEAAKLTVSQEWINALSSIDENTKIIMSADFTDIKKMTIDMAEEIIQ